MWELVGEQVEMWVGCLAGEGTKAFSITLHPASLSLVCSYPSAINRWSTKYIVSLSPMSLSSKLIEPKEGVVGPSNYSKSVRLTSDNLDFQLVSAGQRSSYRTEPFTYGI